MTGTCGQMTKMMMIKSDITHQDDTHARMHAHFLSVVFVSRSRLVDVMNDLTDLFDDFYCLRPFFFTEEFQIHLTGFGKCSDDVLECVQPPSSGHTAVNPHAALLRGTGACFTVVRGVCAAVDR